MAFTASAIWETENGGSDTANGGGFDFSQTAGMFTDGAATVANTNAPIFTSASYNFVAGDVGAWVFIGAGTNWIQGWYKIASVASNAATLNGTIGTAVTKSPVGIPSTVIGCATTASPTGATWSIDYSQQATAQFTYTDLASVGTGLTISSSAKPFAKQQVGNCLVVTGGTNLNTGRYFIASVAAAVATVIAASGNITTGAGVNGTGSLGGALATPGKMVSLLNISGQRQYLKYNATAFTVTTSSTGAGGVLTFPGAVTSFIGYDTVRGDNPSIGGNQPCIAWGATSHGDGDPLVTFANNINQLFENIKIDGSDSVEAAGITCTGSRQIVHNCWITNCSNGSTANAGHGITITAGSMAINCKFDDCIYGAYNAGYVVNCLARTCSTAGIINTASTGSVWNSLMENNTGDGGQSAATSNFYNCTFASNTGDGIEGGATNVYLHECVTAYNGGYGVNVSSANVCRAYKLADYTNTSGRTNAALFSDIAPITLTGDPFVNRAGLDFRPNNTAGAGALLRSVSLGIPGQTNNNDIGALHHADPSSGALFRNASLAGV